MQVVLWNGCKTVIPVVAAGICFRQMPGFSGIPIIVFSGYCHQMSSVCLSSVTRVYVAKRFHGSGCHLVCR